MNKVMDSILKRGLDFMNFTYLKNYPKFEKLYKYCSEAEDLALKYPSVSATSSRKAMEFIVKMIYTAEIDSFGSGLTVFEMVSDERFVNYIGNPTLLNSIHFIRKMGNTAAHGGEITQDDAVMVLKELHFLVGEYCVLLWLIKTYPPFVEPSAQGETTAQGDIETTPSEIVAEKEKVTVQPELIAEFAPRMRNARFQIQYDRDEEENKRLFLIASLREAGWPILKTKNQAMPATAGIDIIIDNSNTADYILYGRDNKPLAVIEYTATSKNLIEGRTKGIEKANALAVKYGYKPIVYYTNGYHIFIIDQLGYKARRVFQFHSIEELELLKLRAVNRQDISVPQIDDTIAGRDYQKQAITAACNTFMQNRRHALLVMATGTGKTRVSIALSDVLLKAGWVKNILFLADRTSLVRQAHKNFTKLLPSVTTSVYSGGSMNRDANARIIFSTYQTMINLINEDNKEFGIGRFDLIIIDEAHRSIFKKYSALFHYFDSLMLGLTATPRAEDNKSTYQMFEMKNGHPDFAYELEQAIKDGYLVGFSVLDKTTESMRRGICYDDLSDEEKEIFEDAFAVDEESTDFSGTVIDAEKLRGWNIINLGTIDAMLNDLMKNGLKIDGGDKLGKTIIFASSHLEAEKIVERFQNLYSHLGLDYCKVIDSQVADNLSLIDSFGERSQFPQITVSVDMMDTGIDVPDVLNLVFFKRVASKIKFLQMIGRGTRLCQDVFGPGEDKQGFLIFDYYDNFRYFRTRHTWSTIDQEQNGKSFTTTPQSILINTRKLGILKTLIEKDNLSSFEEQYKNSLKSFFIDSVRNLCNDNIEVQYNMSYVSKYRTAEQWDGFTNSKVEEIVKHILPLIPPEADSMKVKSFDLMIYVIEDEVPKRIASSKNIRKIRHGFGNVGNKIDTMLEELTKLKTIPEIVQKETLINKMRKAKLLFENFSLEQCEKVRKELRDLMKYIPEKSPVYVIRSHDMVIDNTDSNIVLEKSYSEKAREYILAGNATLSKIRNLDDLTQEEKDQLDRVFKLKLGSEADYAAWSGNKPLIAFLRVQVGIADEAIETKFGSFLNSNTLNAAQLQYMQQIISYTRENGDIAFLDLQRVSPFCDVDIMSLFGTNISYIKTLINGLHRPIL